MLRYGTEENPELTLRYGLFIQGVIDFLIIAVVIFFIVKLVNRARRKKEEPIEEPPAGQKQLRTSYRDKRHIKRKIEDIYERLELY